ncbi:MAG: penicillin-binding protein 1B [Proteobacteria bacterium]|nr:penicillin-binding protein 1B [Pseudomonadota bacterium]
MPKILPRKDAKRRPGRPKSGVSKHKTKSGPGSRKKTSLKKKVTVKKRAPVRKGSKKRPRAKRVSKRAISRGRYPLLRVLLKIFAIIALLVALVLAGWIWVLDRRIQARFDTPFKSIPAHLYARPYTLRPGDALEVSDIRTELLAHGYRQAKEIARPGDFAFFGQVVDILRPGMATHPVPSAVRVELFDGRVLKLTDHRSAKSLEQFELAPGLIGNLMTGPMEDRILLKLHEVPQLLIDGLFTMEDRRFMSHHGVDPLGIMRAIVQNIREGRVTQGGSTLTQQLVKNLYLDDSRTLKRKVNEAMMAMIIEWRYSKNQILERYLNTIFLGQSGNRAIHGFGLAAQFYFGRKLQDLNPAQLALLVGMIPAPSAYNPFRNIERATIRRNLVLQNLHKNGSISAGEVELYKQTGLDVVRSKNIGASRYPAYIDLLNRQLGESYNSSYLKEGGLNVYSTLDESVQQIAQARFKTALGALEEKHAIDAGSLQGAMIILEPKTGEIVALIGARDGKAGDFNRALDAKRPIGSLVKPAVYLTALLNPARYSTSTIIEDTPLSIELETGEAWNPGNYDKQFRGEVSLYEALIRSYNVPAVKVGMDVGLDAVATTLQRLGVREPFPRYPSMLLGASNVSLLDVAQMYQTLANNGRLQPLTTLRLVANSDNQVLVKYQSDGEQMVNARADFLVIDMLQAVAETGTARALAGLIPGVKLAGKTGTTNEYRDSWFAGFGENYLAVVWIGKDDNAPTGLTGSSGALRAWAQVMSGLDLQSLNLLRPEGIVEVEVDVEGGTAVEGCTQQSETRYFIAGYEPLSNHRCEPLDDKLGGWLNKWFGTESNKSSRPGVAEPDDPENLYNNR